MKQCNAVFLLGEVGGGLVVVVIVAVNNGGVVVLLQCGASS